ncbi:hypothetical protein HNP84_004156 [Thermocatellispora tengchongensis]|uniref:Uncharacterized protein n=1 Tax=Thermocatellispora tengchongensis TaxID=1073253 RepID=A0A840NZS2_9ACTN|nr:hypothetical protein [Thermocatellispora tengchongensis]
MDTGILRDIGPHESQITASVIRSMEKVPDGRETAR